MKRGIRPSVQAKSPLSCTNCSRGSGVSNPIALHLFSFVFNLHFLFFLSFFSLALFLLFFTLVTHRTRYARLCEPTSFDFWLPPLLNCVTGARHLRCVGPGVRLCCLRLILTVKHLSTSRSNDLRCVSPDIHLCCLKRALTAKQDRRNRSGCECTLTSRGPRGVGEIYACPACCCLLYTSPSPRD